MGPTGRADRHAEWTDHLRDEADAAYLYDVLASLEPDPRKRDLYAELSEVEGRHVQIWREVIGEHAPVEGPPPVPRPSGRARTLAWVARRFGPDTISGILLREEGREVKAYLALSRRNDPVTRDTAALLARESAEHVETLREIVDGPGANGPGGAPHATGTPDVGHVTVPAELDRREEAEVPAPVEFLGSEPWHRTESGSFLRNVIYGFNDGLTANFGLVAGVIGASAQQEIILIAGLAGTIADALSMGASGYLAAKSEREVYEHEIEIERDEIRLMPEVEEEELSLIYQTKGIPAAQARSMAADIMRDPEQALEEKVREELGIADETTTPLREGWITGTATGVGAIIPVAPFFFGGGLTAIAVSFSISMLSHFGVGAGRSLFTGRGLFRSGFDMFVVGFGVAGVGYLVGELASRLFGLQ